MRSVITANSYVTVTATGSAVQLQSKQVGSATNYSYTLATTSYDSADFTQPSFMNPSASGSLEGGSDGDGGGTPQTIYSYVIPAPTPATATRQMAICSPTRTAPPANGASATTT